MEHTTIRNFRPIETKEDSTDQDRTVLRLCDGFVSVPIGALCNGPQWYPMWNMTNLPSLAAALLYLANPAKAHFITISRGAHVLIVVWSLSLSKPLGLFYVTTGTPVDFDFDSSDAMSYLGTDNAVWRDKNGSAQWFASRVGDRVYFGNGIDANVQWKNGALAALGPSTTPASPYDPSRVAIPACTSFVMGVGKSVFAAGNAAAPKRMWITHPPSAAFPFNEGIYSADTSFVDLTYSDATKITALSAFQNYVTAHTDRKPINVFDVDGSNDGWKCSQAPGAANSSAPSPDALRDTNGMASFYVGADGEVYKDEAIRVGPNDKRAARDQEIATNLGAGDWNDDMQKPVALGRVHTVYDRTQQLFWIFAELDAIPSRMGLWFYNERSRSMAGPLSYPNALVSAAVAGTTDGACTLAIVVTATGELLYTDLATLGETPGFLQEDSDEPLGDDFAQLVAAPTPTPGLSYVAMTPDSGIMSEFLAGGQEVTMYDPWSFFEDGDGVQVFTRFWKNAYIARFETGLMDFGQDELVRNFLELAINWQFHSRAYFGIYAEVDGGMRKVRGGRWHGLAFGKETHRIPINLCGRRIRVRVVAVLFNDAPALVRSVRLGWLPAGTG